MTPSTTDVLATMSFAENGTSYNQTEEVFQSQLNWGWWVLQLGTPVIVVVGLIGNCLSIVVLKSRRFRTKSFSHYLTTLAIFDSLVLTSKYLQRVDSLMSATGHKGGLFGSFGDASCKLYNFGEHVCYLMSSWLVLCTTLERYIAVNYPFKKSTYCRPRNAVTVILVIFAALSYSQIFRLILVESVDSECMAPLRYAHVYVMLQIFFYQILNLRILHKIQTLRARYYQHNQHSCTLTCGPPEVARMYPGAGGIETPKGAPHLGAVVAGGSSEGRRDGGACSGSVTSVGRTSRRQRHKTTCMLLIVSFTYVITLLPLVLLSLIMFISIYTVEREVAEQLFVNLTNLNNVFELFSELNYAVNFYIYVLSGVQFRYSLKQVCTARYIFGAVCRMPRESNEKVFYFRKFTPSNN